MTTPLVVNHRENWLLPGHPNDSRLFHSDPSDRILLYPPHIGQGYRQKIQLRDDLTLVIIDYMLNRGVIRNLVSQEDCVKFDFPLAGVSTQNSSNFHLMIGKTLEAPAVKKRVFEVEIIFQGSDLSRYIKECLDRFPPHTQQLVEDMVKSLWHYQGRRLGLNTAEMMHQLVTYPRSGAFISYPEFALNEVLSDSLYIAMVDLQYANCIPITLSMELVLGDILSCPYQGTTRRRYLERKVMELVMLRLQAIVPPRLHPTELSCIYHAASILRSHLVNPPTVEGLARQVGTNRLKLNQGFHEVYGTTPYRYLRDCRLLQAQRLLINPDLSVEKVAASVGYRSRNHFAKAFRRQIGLNPKVFQMQTQVWLIAS